MDDTQLTECLQSVGKQLFVRCFWTLRAASLGRLSQAACAQTILNQGHQITLDEVLLRIRRAQAIFATGQERAVLALVMATRHPAERRLREEAEEICARFDRLYS